MRSLSLLIFTLRILILSAIVYNFTRFLPGVRASGIRTRTTLWGARKIAQYFMKQGGIYIKAAQYLATISNLLEADYTEIFADVAEKVVIRPYENIRYRFLEEFGVEPEELYLEFDRTALTAASLGQVHVARIRDGRKVAVKFLHPNIETQIRQDIRAIRLSTMLIRWFFPYMDFRRHFTEFSSMIASEVDYTNEAENMRRARYQFAGDPRIVIPDVISELSRSTVLTTEFVEGIPINNLKEMDRLNINRSQVAELLLESYARMVFEHRFYHADPHPGNIFVIPSNDPEFPIKMGFVDFGATQNITERIFSYFQRFMEVLQLRDIASLVDLAVETGMLREKIDHETYTNLFELVYARYGSFKIEDYYRINPMRFGRMVKTSDLNAAGLRMRDLVMDIKLPRKYIYLGRTMTLLISLATRLDEQVNFFTVIRPHLEVYLSAKPKNILGYIRRRNWLQVVDRALTNRGGSNRQLIQPGGSGPGYSGQTLRRLTKQGILTVLTMTGAAVWTALLLGGRDDYAEPTLYATVGCLGVLVFYLFFRKNYE